MCILLAYMHGLLDKLDINNDINLQKDLEKILRTMPLYLDIMLMITMYLI